MHFSEYCKADVFPEPDLCIINIDASFVIDDHLNATKNILG